MSAASLPEETRDGQARSPWGRRILIGIAIAYMTVILLAPLIGLVVGAFAQGIGAIISALDDPQVRRAFFLTLVISFITIIVHTVLGTTVAWMLVRHQFPGRSIINALIDLPFAISPVVAGYMLILVFGRRGLFGPVLDSWGVQIVFALPGMILATLIVTLPFMVRELIPVLREFGVEQELAAATLGASGWQIFRLVTFPALRWGFVYGITLTFARALGEFGAVLVVSGGVQGRTETATTYIFRALDDRQTVGAYSAALLLGTMSLILVMGAELMRNREKQG
jgi:sulfate/thiosulfate transport system permease protein